MQRPVIVYSDFNCPFCYALNEALRLLDGPERLSWRGVQHAPWLSVPMAVWRAELGRELRREVEAVRRLAPGLPIEVPPGKPNTTAAIRAAALALRLDRQRGQAFKDLLYRAFWCGGADLSHPDTLGRLAEEAGFAGQAFARPDRHEIVDTTSAWQQEWEESGCHAIPALVREDGTKLVGWHGPEQIEQFLQPAIGARPVGESPA